MMDIEEQKPFTCLGFVQMAGGSINNRWKKGDIFISYSHREVICYTCFTAGQKKI